MYETASASTGIIVGGGGSRGVKTIAEIPAQDVLNYASLNQKHFVRSIKVGNLFQLIHFMYRNMGGFPVM